MASPRAGAALLLAALGGAFVWAAANLLERRLAGGDVYPASSSLKADPDGARALYEALLELRGPGVRRNYEAIGRLEAGPRTALLFLGTDPMSLEEAGRREAERLDSAVRSGTRLVIGLSPSRSLWRIPEPTPTPKAGKAGQKKGDLSHAPRRQGRPPGEDSDEDALGVSLSKKWGFALEWGEPFASPAAATLAAPGGPPLPGSVPWKAGSFFAKLDAAWHAVYTLEGRPVLLERTLGRGSIVLATDSTFASNESLKSARQPELLAWLVGDKPEIVFDETHLGMGQREGIAALARRYHLEGLFAGLLVLALLFVWKSAAPFAQAPGPSSPETAPVAGRRASEGLAAVLRRHVAREDLARICLGEWKRAFGRGRPAAVRELSRAALEKDPVAAYRRASALTKQKGLA